MKMEPDRKLKRQELWVRSWPGHEAWQMRAIAHAHGLWIEGL